MRLTSIPLTISIFLLAIACDPKPDTVTFNENTDNKSIDVLINGQLFTTYRWPDNVTKPVLCPVLASSGTEITRGFPLSPKVGERADHPHQIGMWLTYGNVDENDFWGNGFRGLGTLKETGGVIKHLNVERMSGGIDEGVLVTNESWVDSTGIELMTEKTEYHFLEQGSVRIIDRITTLTATDKKVMWPDTKEGMFGIRVARQLELPDEGRGVIYTNEGKAERVDTLSNDGITGNYRSSEGVTGWDVWGTRAKWMDLDGSIGDEKISIVICDHPNNPNYPTYWHARGYGLFSANPFGWNDFTDGKQQANFEISAGDSVTFRYRVIVSSGGHLSNEDITSFVTEFEELY
ncbi:MAG: PmoA family protein [Bacteroidota bacterium]